MFVSLFTSSFFNSWRNYNLFSIVRLMKHQSWFLCFIVSLNYIWLWIHLPETWLIFLEVLSINYGRTTSVKFINQQKHAILLTTWCIQSLLRLWLDGTSWLNSASRGNLINRGGRSFHNWRDWLNSRFCCVNLLHSNLLGFLKGGLRSLF